MREFKWCRCLFRVGNRRWLRPSRLWVPHTACCALKATTSFHYTQQLSFFCSYNARFFFDFKETLWEVRFLMWKEHSSGNTLIKFFSHSNNAWFFLIIHSFWFQTKDFWREKTVLEETLWINVMTCANSTKHAGVWLNSVQDRCNVRRRSFLTHKVLFNTAGLFHTQPR